MQLPITRYHTAWHIKRPSQLIKQVGFFQRLELYNSSMCMPPKTHAVISRGYGDFQVHLLSLHTIRNYASKAFIMEPQQIILPDTRYGRKAQYMGQRFWLKRVKENVFIQGQNSEILERVRDGTLPVLLHTDLGIPRTRIDLDPPGIVLRPEDPFAVKLSKVTNPSLRSRIIRRLTDIILLLIGGLVVFWLMNLESVPVTGRWRFNNCSTRALELALVTYERKKKALKQSLLPDEHPYKILVSNVLQKLVEANGLQDIEWEVSIVNAPTIDQASVYPGGKMIIHSGVIPFCEDEDSLASLLSHEIAHVVASHAAERISQYFFFDMARKPALHVFYQLKASEYEMKGPLLVLGIYAIGLESLKARFRRDRESEADYTGLVIMARAGFDLRKACGYWERSGIAREARRVKEKGSGKVTSAERLLSSHPQMKERVQQMKKWIPEVMEKTGWVPASEVPTY